MTGVLRRRERTDTQEEGLVMIEAGIGVDAAEGYGMPRTYGHYQKPGRDKEVFYPESQREPGCAAVVISDF